MTMVVCVSLTRVAWWCARFCPLAQSPNGFLCFILSFISILNASFCLIPRFLWSHFNEQNSDNIRKFNQFITRYIIQYKSSFPLILLLSYFASTTKLYMFTIVTNFCSAQDPLDNPRHKMVDGQTEFQMYVHTYTHAHARTGTARNVYYHLLPFVRIFRSFLNIIEHSRLSCAGKILSHLKKSRRPRSRFIRSNMIGNDVRSI